MIRGRRSKEIKFLIVGILALIALSSIVAQQQSASAVTNANGNLNWKLINGTSPTNPSVFQVSITPPKLDGQNKLPPSDLVVSFSISVNGNVYYTSHCTFPGAGSLNLGSCNFKAPTDGAGEYLFTANFNTNSGPRTLLAQAIVDPRVDPDW